MVSSKNDPVAPAKLISEFIKDNRIMEIKGGLVEGKVIDADAVKALANLPPREVLIARLVGQHAIANYRIRKCFTGEYP